MFSFLVFRLKEEKKKINSGQRNHCSLILWLKHQRLFNIKGEISKQYIYSTETIINLILVYCNKDVGGLSMDPRSVTKSIQQVFSPQTTHFFRNQRNFGCLITGTAY